ACITFPCVLRACHPLRRPFPTRRSSDLTSCACTCTTPSPVVGRRSCSTRPPPTSVATRTCSSRSSPPRATPRTACGRVSSTRGRSEEHTSELQSRENLVCRLLLEKKTQH